MARATKKKKTPRKQHPYLVGCTTEEAALIERGASRHGLGPTTFLRTCAMIAARKALGLKRQEVLG